MSQEVVRVIRRNIRYIKICVDFVRRLAGPHDHIKPIDSIEMHLTYVKSVFDWILLIVRAVF